MQLNVYLLLNLVRCSCQRIAVRWRTLLQNCLCLIPYFFRNNGFMVIFHHVLVYLALIFQSPVRDRINCKGLALNEITHILLIHKTVSFDTM
jgi:hypothetical protein